MASSALLREATSLLPSPTSTDSADPISPPQPKRSRIEAAIAARDVSALRSLAAEVGGFECKELRAQVWPILLGPKEDVPGEDQALGDVKLEASTRAASASPERGEQRSSSSSPLGADLPAHKDENQVRLDVLRSFVSYPANLTADAKDALRERLQAVIVHVLRTYPALHYFQGYHDIISVLLLTIDDPRVMYSATERMSLHRVRDSMGPGLEPVLGYLRLVNRILEREDPQLALMVQEAAALPYFSLSWVLTLMSHDLSSLSVLSRVFDFLLAHNPAMISYLGTAVILLKKEELALLSPDSTSDPAILHHTLSKVPNLVEEGFPFPASSTFKTESERELGFSTADLVSAPASTHSEGDSLMSSSMISIAEASQTDATTTDTQACSGSSTTSSTSSLTHITEPVEYDPDQDDTLHDFSSSALSDPDVSGPAFSHSRSRSSSIAHLRKPSISRSPSSPRSPLARPTNIETLIQSALELWERHPLVGEKGINADEVMGPKSCVFTWGISRDGMLSDAEAAEIVRAGVEIVVPEAQDLPHEKEENPAPRDDKKGARERRLVARRRRTLWLIGTAVGVVGVGVLLAAVWGGENGAWKKSAEWKWFSPGWTLQLW